MRSALAHLRRHKRAHYTSLRALSTHAWGAAEAGQLGLPKSHLSYDMGAAGETCARPAEIPCLRHSRLRHVATSGSHSAFVRDDGALLTTGYGRDGQLGWSHFESSTEPAAVTKLPPAARVACGSRHTLVLAEDGRLFAFGSDVRGQLGVGGAPGGGSAVPLEVRTLLEAGVKVVDVGAGDDFSAAVSEDGRVFTWGCAGQGRLGHGGERVQPSAFAFLAGVEARDETFPRLVKGLEGVKVRRIYCGKRHAVAVCEGGRAYSWGCGRHFLLGTGRDDDELEPVEAFAAVGRGGVKKVAAGGMHSLVLGGGGSVFVLGVGEFGCLGLGPSRGGGVERDAVRVDGVAGAADVAAGWHVSAAVVPAKGEGRGGEVYTWGCGAGGALGSGEFVDHWAPYRVGLSAEKIVAGVVGGSMVAY